MPLLGGGPRGGDLREKREQIVREHMDSENRHEFDATLETFHYPRYELVGTGEVYDGHEEVSAYFEETRKAFPDQRNELVKLYHADDAVIVEAWLRGTHKGSFRGLPPTGRSFETEILAIFEFDGDRLMCERVYFNPGSVLEQLGVARSPLSIVGRLGTVASHPLTIGRGLVRRVVGR